MKTEIKLRELDEWIAVNLFNWDVSRVGWCDSAIKHCVGKSCYGFPPDSANWKTCALPHLIPCYTTDLDATMMVLEKCNIRQSEKDFIEMGIKKTGKQKRNHYLATAEFSVNAKTLSLAICLFAKKLFTK